MAGLLSAPVAAPRTSLRGSPASMVRQHEVAVEHDYTFARDEADVERLTALGRLVPLSGRGGYRLARVSHPYARPEVRALVERLAPEYRRSCGESLVITSLTRPAAEQPGNAHKLSVHPAGMAVDLRISRSAACRAWLEGRLLALERKGSVDATREKNPPHYHVAVLSTPPAAPARPRAARPRPAPTPAVAARRVPGPAPAPRAAPAEAEGGDAAAAVAAAGILLALVGWAVWVSARRG